jgi:outer membrane receptor protein involved in Fe transport
LSHLYKLQRLVPNSRMKKLLLIAFCCYLHVTLLAQTTPKTLTVKGIAIDSATNKPLGYVTVALLDAKTQQSVKAGLTKDDGSFILTAPLGKTYQAAFASVGYRSKVVNISGSGAEVSLGKMLLSVSNSQLKEVSVNAVRPVMKQEVDRISYDVQADPESKAITALDMMRKVPLLSVDAEDNIKLKGSGNYKILINGKESALMAKSPSDVLRAMPASNIEKIEVITTPPAKYDAEGLAGIINIITKKNVDQGYNVNLGARYNTIWGPGLNLNASVKQGKFGLSTFTGINKRNGFDANTENSQIFSGGQSITQDGTNHNTGNNYYTWTDLSYEIDSLNLLTGSFGTYRGINDQSGNLLSNTLNNDGSVAQQYRQMSINNNRFQGYDVGLNYQLGFKNNKEQLLTLSYKYNYSPNQLFGNNVFSDRVNDLESEQPSFNQDNSSGDKEHTVQIDYAQPFKKVTLEVGGKAIIRDNFSNFTRSDLDPASNQYNLNPLYTDDFNYHQDVYSLYNSYQIKLDNYVAKVGLRLEHTSINADSTSANTKVKQSYNNLIPSISIQRKFKTSSINFGFTQRIQRPSIYQLNPFVDNSNPKFISTGNPNLRPELNNTFEFTYSNFAKNSFNAGLSYAFSNNAIQNVTSLLTDNTAKDTVTSTTYQNLGSNRTLGLNINTNLSIAKNLSFNVNGQIARVWLTGTFNEQFYKNSGFTGNAFGSLGYKFGTGYRIGLDAGFFSGDVNLQGKTSNFIYNSYVLTKEFLNKKASISLAANNPYSKYHDNTSYTNTPQFIQSSFNEDPYRSFNIRINYKFGKLNSEIKKSQHSINNDDTKGGGKSTNGS